MVETTKCRGCGRAVIFLRDEKGTVQQMATEDRARWPFPDAGKVTT